MVAISLYRGNLHRVADVPRRWLMPTPRISLKEFRFLINKRSKALTRLRSAATSNPNAGSSADQQGEGVGDNGCSKQDPQEATEDPHPQSQQVNGINISVETPSRQQNPGDANDRNGQNGDRFPVQPGVVDSSVSSPAANSPVRENGSGSKDGSGTSQALAVISTTPNLEVINKPDVSSDIEKRKREIEEKLQFQNARKHNLVQMLKQILNAEEEMKRRSSMHGSVIRPVPLQVDATTDSGSMTRLVTPRMGSETNFVGDLEAGEAEDASNHSTHARHLFRMRSTSPSADSPLRRPPYGSLQHNMVPHTTRVVIGAAGSPSRFAPTVQQGHPVNAPSVSLSGSHYIASSPSPAASGGTSAFRDPRLTSPSWNQ